MFVSLPSLTFPTWLRRLPPLTLLLMLTHMHLIHAQGVSEALDLTTPEGVFALAQKGGPKPRGVDINVVNDNYNNALHLAAKNNDVAAASWLIDQGIRINFINRWHKSPLHYAARYSDLELVELLTRSGARVNLGDTSDILERIAYWFASRKRYIFPSKGTSLHSAILANNEAISDYLITHGAHVNATSSRGETPLYKAAKRNQFALARLLVVNGADISKGSDSEKDTPLHQVLRTEKPNPDFAQYLIDQGAPIEVKDAFGSTPLYYAVGLNDISVTSHLIAQGADIFTRDNDNSTLLHVATFSYHYYPRGYPPSLDIIKLLVSNGVDVNAKNEHDSSTTALHISASLADLDVIRYLLQNGANLEARNQLDQTPLLSAMMRLGNKPVLEVIKFLVESGADIHVYSADPHYPEYQFDLMFYARLAREKEPALYDYVVSLFQ